MADRFSRRFAMAAISLVLPMAASQAPVAAAEAVQLDPLAAIQHVWPPQYLPTAIRIARRESGLSPSARGCAGSCYGLFQIHYPSHRRWMASIGIHSPQQLLDPLLNSKAAYHLFQATGRNWSPWTTSR